MNSVAVMNAYVHLSAVATLSVLAVAVAVAAVVVLVLGEAPVDQEVQMASALGGEDFAKDVARTKAEVSMKKLREAIEENQVLLPDGISKAQVLASLNNTLQRHKIV